jgi:hypothetical protein
MTLDDAIEYYLEVRTSDQRADLIAAAQEAARRRSEGPTFTRMVLQALQEMGMSYRDIEEASRNPVTGDYIAKSTVHALIAGRQR